MKSMTDENCEAWGSMGITKDWQIKRMYEWANMLESRLLELDPDYRSYPFGRTIVGEVIQKDRLEPDFSIGNASLQAISFKK